MRFRSAPFGGESKTAEVDGLYFKGGVKAISTNRVLIQPIGADISAITEAFARKSR